MRRPGRIRVRMFLVIALFGIIFVTYGRRHPTELHFTASVLTSYIPTSITEAIATYGENEDTRWNDGESRNASNRIVIKKPKFHLLISAHQPTAKLCKTLLSAAILNYPTPVLINYGKSLDGERPGADVVKGTYSFLHGKEVRDEDMVLILEEDTLLQLPAEIAISRFIYKLEESAIQLLKKYGRVVNSNLTQVPKLHRVQKYRQTVLFSSTKECSGDPSDPACYSIPESPLPKDVYGPKIDHHVEAKSNSPRYMASGMVTGRVADLRPIYKHASEILEFEDDGKKGSQYVFSQIFGEQEYARTLSLSAAGANVPTWRNWFSSLISRPIDPSITPPNITLAPNQNHEFGIGLDYLSSVFQVMENSVEDIQVVRFDDQSAMTVPSRIGTASYKIKHVHLPKDLSMIPPPFAQSFRKRRHLVICAIAEKQHCSLLSTRDSQFSRHDNNANDIWRTMWYHNSSRALLSQHVNSPVQTLATVGGEHWFDVRGGNGGAWTERGEWVPWNDICGSFDDEVFGDGLGTFKINGGDTPAGHDSQEKDGMVKGLWENIVGVTEDEAKEKSIGDGGTVGGFTQVESAVSVQAQEDKPGDNGDGTSKNIEGGKYQLETVDEVKDVSSKSKGYEHHDGGKASGDDDKKENDKGDDSKKDDDEKATVQRIEVENTGNKKFEFPGSADRQN
ncbi:uncharacterized protein RSE6_06325 [Rhynchosporium secalis]|uniref:Uncharacterized protein n=1 Tax=Rhynchosporium secalis TaxID=38038 RepID=A0A1E1MA53_RHYSE|nr:uncharacterized protein RSE6_06325 [Rhynchosporium secalis]